MISESHTLYGSARLPGGARHGKSRRWQSYHASSASVMSVCGTQCDLEPINAYLGQFAVRTNASQTESAKPKRYPNSRGSQGSKFPFCRCESLASLATPECAGH